MRDNGGEYNRQGDTHQRNYVNQDDIKHGNTCQCEKSDMFQGDSCCSETSQDNDTSLGIQVKVMV